MKIIVLDKKGVELASYKSVLDASKGEGLSRGTIQRSIQGYRIKGNRIFKKVDDGSPNRYLKNKKCVLIKEGQEIEIFNTQKELAERLNTTQGTISHYLKGYYKPKGYKIMYYDDYAKLYGEVAEKQQEKEIVKPNKTEYYINILVGLVNGTLIEGATYYVNGMELKYNKKDSALETKYGMIYLGTEKLLEEVKIEMPLLKDKEREFIKTTLMAFPKAKGIRKCNDIFEGFEFLRIEAENQIDNIDFPKFKEGQYYTNLEQNRLYTIEELDI